MSGRFIIKVFFTGSIFLTSMHPAVSQATGQGNYLSIEMVIDKLE